ncbi:MAG: hypothetical protein MJ240_08330 [Kiritimatiellae bacterium]|nr:hypothetical protein [Kiritimatiellia bacterium]
MKRLVGCGLLALLAMLCGCDRSVSDYRAEKFQEIRAKLATEPQWVIAMQQVLDARHGSVRVKAIEAEDIAVRTLGDDAMVKRDLSNLKTIDVTFRIAWDGSFHKDGYTCTTFVFDKDWNVKRILPGESDALIDIGGGNGKNVRKAQEDLSRRFTGTKEQLRAVMEEAQAKLNRAVASAKEEWRAAKPKIEAGMKALDEQVAAALRESLAAAIESANGEPVAEPILPTDDVPQAMAPAADKQ